MSTWQKPPLGAQPIIKVPGLVGDWVMNESGGSRIYDSSGNGNTGTLVGDTHFVGGRVGPALSFDGTGDSVTFGNKFNFGDSDYTISALIQIDAKDDVYVLVAKGKNSLAGVPTDLEFVLQFNQGADIFRFAIANQTTAQSIDATTLGSPVIGTPYLVTGIHKASTNSIEIYINGILDNSASTSVTPSASTGEFNIGSYDLESINDKNMNGLIEYVSVYHRALNLGEINQISIDSFWHFRHDPIELWAAATAGAAPAGIVNTGSILRGAHRGILRGVA